MATTDGRRGAYTQYGNADIEDSLANLDPISVGTSAADTASITIGPDTIATGDESVAIGAAATCAAAASAVAIGDGAQSIADNSICIGTNSRSGAFTNAICLGQDALAASNGEFVLNNITAVAAGATNGTGAAVLANVEGYLQLKINGTIYKIALYLP